MSALVTEGVLITTPAVGSIVAEPRAGGRRERDELLGTEVERLVVEARKLGLEQGDVQAAVTEHWEEFDSAGRLHSQK